MKKIFTLVGLLLLAVPAFAQNEGEGEFFENAEPLYVSVGQWYGDYSFLPYETNIVKLDEGKWSIQNVLYGDFPCTFQLGEKNDKGQWPTTFVDNVMRDKYYTYITNENGSQTGTKLRFNDEDFTVKTVIDVGFYEYYCWVEPSDEPEKGFLHATFYMVCRQAKNYYYPTMEFYFGHEGDMAAVEGIEADNAAPVEYYNLQGVRVANPSNGIFIRCQGNDVKKVVR